MFIWDCTLFITSIGQGEPAMMPVRRLPGRTRQTRVVELGDEHRRHAVERGAALPAPPSARPVDRRPRRGRPWSRRGSGSPDCPSPCRSSDTAARECTAGRGREAEPAGTKKPLFRMLRWLSVAPLGWPVVPEVNWMLMASSQCRFGRSRPAARLGGAAAGPRCRN